MKLCKDCKWWDGDRRVPYCTNPDAIASSSWIEGDGYTGLRIGASCRVQRSLGWFDIYFIRLGGCGKSARYWEPRA